ncbi:MAG: SRPBCC family protein [Candidatus Hodarchaeales archaeon]
MSKKLTVEKSIRLEADKKTVWNALTNPKLTKQFFLNCEAISNWNAGDTITYKMNSDGKEVIPVKGLITRVKSEQFLEYTCFAPEFENDVTRHTRVTYQLISTDSGTKLLVSQGEFKNEEQYNHTHESWDIVLNGLKTLVEK